MGWKEGEYGSHVDEIDDEPTSFLYHVYLGCTQRECTPNGIMKEEFSKMLESRISSGATEKLPRWENSHAKTVVRHGGTCSKMR